MYKVKTSALEGLKKQLEANNKLLASLKETPALNTTNVKISNQIKANEKQIKLLQDEYYI